MLAAIVLLLAQAEPTSPPQPPHRDLFQQGDSGALASLEEETRSLYKTLRPVLVQVRVPFLVEESDGSKVREVVSVSGVIIDEAGLLVAPGPIHHAPKRLVVIDRDAREFQARVLAQDAAIGLTLLQAEGLKFKPPELGCAEALAIGSVTISLGNGLGLDGTLDIGWLSGKRRRVADVSGLLQITNNINLGDGGGLLANRQGQVVGILFTSLEEAARRHLETGGLAAQPDFTSSRGVAFAVPIDQVLRAFEPYLKRRPFPRRLLGVYVQDLPVRLEVQPQQTGLRVKSVVPGSPAERAGLQAGDILLRLGKTPVCTWECLTAALATDCVKMEVLVLRAGEEVILQVELGGEEIADPQARGGSFRGGPRKEARW